MSKTLDAMMASLKVEEALDVRAWIPKTPYLNFGEGYEVCPIFPFCGAQARLLVRNVKDHSRNASIYLDTHSVLGCMDNPYWECMAGGEPERFGLNDTKGLVKFVKKQLAPKKKTIRKKK